MRTDEELLSRSVFWKFLGSERWVGISSQMIHSVSAATVQIVTQSLGT